MDSQKWFAVIALIAVFYACPAYADPIPQWVPDPVPIATGPGQQVFVNGVEDAAGCHVIVWMGNQTGNNDIYAQRLDQSGNVLWGAGVTVCNAGGNQSTPVVVRDGGTGTIIAWHDRRAGNDDIYAQRLNANGIPQWAANGQVVCNDGFDQQNVVAVVDGLGGVFIAWTDMRGGGGADSDIYVQRMNAAGVAQWVANGVPTCAAVNNQERVGIVRDAADGVVVVWSDWRNGNYDIYAQRIDGAGAVQWALDGVAVCAAPGDQEMDWSNAAGISYYCSDLQGGIIVGWTDSSGADRNTQVARVNAAGVLSWLQTVCSQAGDQQSVRIASDGSGGVFAVWQDFRNGADNDIYAQRVSLAGAVQWAIDGIPIATGPTEQTSGAVVEMTGGDVVIVWIQDVGIQQIWGQRIDVAGNPSWTANGVVVWATQPGWGGAGYRESAGGFVILICQDNGGTQDVFGQLWRDPAASSGGDHGGGAGGGGCFVTTGTRTLAWPSRFGPILFTLALAFLCTRRRARQ
ncbi:MAG: hypothetical protein RDV41_07955 [Planctomycetota bacterium]|nr:hypothetical protein [Planctomycetota bacterium]